MAKSSKRSELVEQQGHGSLPQSLYRVTRGYVTARDAFKRQECCVGVQLLTWQRPQLSVSAFLAWSQSRLASPAAALAGEGGWSAAGNAILVAAELGVPAVVVFGAVPHPQSYLRGVVIRSRKNAWSARRSQLHCHRTSKNHSRLVELVTRELRLLQTGIDTIVRCAEPQACRHPAARLRWHLLEELLEMVCALAARIEESKGVDEGV